jgi:hypothetical protein
MPDQHDRRQIEVDRADRRLIEQAAARLRHGAPYWPGTRASSIISTSRSFWR